MIFDINGVCVMNHRFCKFEAKSIKVRVYDVLDILELTLIHY